MGQSGSGSGRGGMGQKMGQGRGGMAPETETTVGFKTERAKVRTQEGTIISEILFKGDQVKGDASVSPTETFRDEERRATDLINRDRVPRQYQKAIKRYFSSVLPAGSGADDEDGAEDGGESEEDGNQADEASSGDET